MFSRKESLTAAPEDAPLISTEVRLPEPAILTCGQPIPLRMLVTTLNALEDHLSIQSLQLDIVGSTHVRAHDVHRTETNGTVLISQSNMAVPLRFPLASKESFIDPKLWSSQIIPNTLPPSFETCNIRRSYEVVARVGISYTPPGMMVRSFTMHESHSIDHD